MLVAGLAALLGFLLGVFVGYGSAEPSEKPAPRVTVTVEGTEQPESGPTGSDPSSPVQPTQPTQPAQPQGTPPGATPPGATPSGAGQPTGGTGSNPALSSLSMRTLVVGTDIQPGTYRTTGPTAGIPMCYWARLRSATGDEIASGMPSGPASVTILATDKAFRTAGCAEWTRA